MKSQIRKAGETRGFAESRLLTEWAEIAGPDIAAISRPVNVRYPRGSFGATLVLLTNGANAPLLQAQTPMIRDRVNACYGYAAIANIKVTQTATTGFAEGRVEFRPQKIEETVAQPSIEHRDRAKNTVRDVKDQALAQALESLGANVISKSKSKRA